MVRIGDFGRYRFQLLTDLRDLGLVVLVGGAHFADLLQRFTGDLIGGKTTQQATHQFVLARGVAQVDFAKHATGARLSQLPQYVLQFLLLGKAANDFIEFLSGILITLAL